MPKIAKLFLFLICPLFLLLGGAYGLAKVGVIPVKKLTAKNKLAGKLAHMIGLDSPKLPAVQVTPARAVVPDPLAAQKKELEAKNAAFEKQRADWEAVQKLQAKAAETKVKEQETAVYPKSIARLAAVYEQMPADTANKIFTKLPDAEVIALLRKMDEKKVSQILAIVAPDRAARLTLSLSKPAATAPLASGTQ
jgi:flagellar motility protein MotE (MotC chaperone)